MQKLSQIGKKTIIGILFPLYGYFFYESIVFFAQSENIFHYFKQSFEVHPLIILGINVIVLCGLFFAAPKK